MKRTQISLNFEEYEAARKQARALGISLAEFFRRALRKDLPLDTSRPWMQYCGLVSSGDARSSITIDEIVYGHKD